MDRVTFEPLLWEGEPTAIYHVFLDGIEIGVAEYIYEAGELIRQYMNRHTN